MQRAAADRHECAVRGRSLSNTIVSPASGGSILPDTAGMGRSAADGHERLTAWRRCLSVEFIAPADGGSILPEGTGVRPATAHYGERLAGRE